MTGICRFAKARAESESDKISDQVDVGGPSSSREGLSCCAGCFFLNLVDVQFNCINSISVDSRGMDFLSLDLLDPDSGLHRPSVIRAFSAP